MARAKDRISGRLFGRPVLLAATGLLVGVVLLGAMLLYLWRSDPGFVFLTGKDGAQWVKYPAPPSIIANIEATEWTVFRTHFEVSDPLDQAELIFTAFGQAQTFLNNEPVQNDEATLENWKHPRRIDLAPRLRTGTNTLHISVINTKGPPMLIARAPALGLRTSPAWDVSPDGSNWTTAAPASSVDPAPISKEFPSAWGEFLATLPYLLPVFITVYLLSLVISSDRPMRALRAVPRSPEAVRWLLIIAVGILGINNLGRLSSYVGMDAGAHVLYLHIITNEMRIPLANEGVQAFQPPLFYLVAAFLHVPLAGLFEHATVDQLIRLIPIACGLGQIEIVYRMSKHIFPENPLAQTTAIVSTGLLPMNIYMSQVVSNEPFFALFGALALYCCARMVTRPRQTSWRPPVLLGLLFGLAFLSKVSAVLLFPSIALALALWCAKTKRPFRAFVLASALFVAVAVPVSAWFYARNWVHFGQFFISGWDPLTGARWWQQPGYRTIHQYSTFGLALFHPVYSALPSFWDGLYSTLWMDGYLSGIPNVTLAPPWNFRSMLAGVWWALVPTAALLLGFIRSGVLIVRSDPELPIVGAPRRAGLIICTLATLTFFGAILAHGLTTPYYNAIKSSYALAAAPCIGCLIAAGFTWATPTRHLRASGQAALACWAILVYTAYFVI